MLCSSFSVSLSSLLAIFVTLHASHISVNDKDYQIPSTELLRRHKIYRRPSPEYDYILLDKNSKSLNKQSVKAADEVRRRLEDFIFLLKYMCSLRR